ncbi:sigma 54-interacting transcriptional regulator [Myxococcota bacterium]|nr:sigma 54-interacting transcriptional regulator [Myxococcota bacterium]
MAVELGTTLSDVAPEEGRERFVLAVLGEDAMFAAPLPEVGRVHIGRARENEVWLEDALVSRQHAELAIDRGTFELVDLGSANGTFIGGERLASGGRRAIAPGVAFELGSTMFVVQRRSATSRVKRLWPHEYFELRVEEECTRPRRGAAGLTVLWVRLEADVDEAVFERALHAALLPSDVVARWIDREYELLLLGSQLSHLEEVRSAITHAVGPRGATIGQARFPADGTSAEVLLDRAREAARPTRRGADGPVVEEPAMRDLYRMIDKVARGRIAVLLVGETGVGKEIVAEAVHARSPRSQGPLVRLNCGAFAESLLEAELFGYEKGAFTGADRAKAGLIEAGQGGTVFLDEVGEMPASVQAKLLRVLETRQVQRVGALEPRAVDVRFVAATNRDLELEVMRGNFRQDLLFRLNGVTFAIPPLRERRSEIIPLAERFAVAAARDAGLRRPELRPEARRWLEQHDWPGNVRELRNVVERAVLLAGDGPVTLEELPIEKSARRTLASPPPLAAAQLPGRAPNDPGLDPEKQRILAALEACAGNQSRAAKVLGLSRRTLIRRLDEYAVARPRGEGSGA